MRRSGVADLPLHGGKAPPWLMRRMVKLAGAVVKLIVYEYGRAELLRRLSDPYWFQALGCALGYDWHSSGLTTVVTAALREGINPADVGIAVCGGKGKRALEAPRDIERAADALGLSDQKVSELKRVSMLTAKVDNAAVQDGYSIYHHVIIITEEGTWAVIQQGMNPSAKLARRYHWLSEGLRSFVEDPHAAIAAQRVEDSVLNLVARESRGSRKAIVDAIHEGVRRLKAWEARARGFETLDAWLGAAAGEIRVKVSKYLRMPWQINWDAVEKAYNLGLKRFEDVLLVKGLGPSTLRGLALIADLVYGEEPSWRDPAKYSFAYGGKDGVPYPVNIKAMDESISFLADVIRAVEAERREKLEALKRLYALLNGRG